MLTPANVFMLGIINHNPINPYEIEKIFEFNRMKSTLKVASSTIYASIRAMHKRGLVVYKVQANGNMPVKRIYEVTEKGRAELMQSLQTYLSDYFPDWSGFTISLLFMSLFEKGKLIKMLTKRKKVLDNLYQKKEEEYQTMLVLNATKPCIPAMSGALHLRMHVRIELDITNRVIDLIRTAEVWPQDFYQIYSTDIEGYIEQKKA